MFDLGIDSQGICWWRGVIAVVAVVVAVVAVVVVAAAVVVGCSC